MDRRRYERIGELFGVACELDGAEREAYLANACRNDDALRAEVQALLDKDARPDSRLSTDDAQRGQLIRQALRSAEGTDRDAPLSRIGPYKLLEKIGVGGMGEVYAADQLHPVRRRVALKLIKRGMDSEQVVARFEAERQALARMSHPNVAQVYDGGTTDDGRPYFVMEYVAGEPITDSCNRRKLSTHDRVELFLGVCEGVQHAHQKGIIHRDLKPSNVLVMQQDGHIVPKIIDFGVARAMTGRLGEHTLHTMLGQVVGTLDYMSPEQADPTGVDVDTRSDIYSLGVVLYQLVSGLLPFDFSTATDVSLSDVQRAIREQEPPTPSTRLSRETATATSIAAQHGTDQRSLARQLHGDLDWICLKALEKDPARRYASASELADDLRRYLADEPVLAGRPGALYRLRKFVRRNRVGVTAGVLVVVGLVAGAVGIVSGRIEAEAKAEQLKRERDAWRVAPLMADVDALWPAVPARIAALEDWLASARALVSSLAAYRDSLAARRSEGRGAPGTLVSVDAPDHEDPWRDDLPTDLLESLEHMDTDLLSEDGVSQEHGTSVPQRLAMARALEAGFAKGGTYAEAWSLALPAIRATYPGLDLSPQMGLLPLGVDSQSGLWEFAHLLSGTPARRDPQTQEIVMTPETGLVLILLPGARYMMGSQFSDKLEPNYVPTNIPERRPIMELIENLHPVSVEAFFISKYELTMGQWERFTGSNPSSTGGGMEPGLPVNRVTHVECTEICWRLGLVLPSEEQWEYAARAGTTTRWWMGDKFNALPGNANLGDPQPWEPAESRGGKPLADGIIGLAEVGSFRANPFGLHDVLGNVSEWTSSLQVATVPGEPPREARDEIYLARGGNYLTIVPPPTRSAYRLLKGPPGFQTPNMGLRPARPVRR